jgi:hypothetical protein
LRVPRRTPEGHLMHQSDLFEPHAPYASPTVQRDRFAALAPADLTDGERDSVIHLALRVLEPTVTYDAFSDPEATSAAHSAVQRPESE